MISEKQLCGAWTLESWTIGYSDREDISAPFGEEPDGLLLYTPEGWMSVSINARDRARLPEDVSFARIPPELKAAAYGTSFHYAGRYRVEDGHVVHAVTHSLNPNFTGTEQWRHAELDGQTLVLSGKDEVGGITRFHALVWHKLPAPGEVEVLPG
ncbi:MAG: lipocalin-like domain-containing protein [Halioglobus sp.]|nr:lipocalin-like domain-containing protein [Halioglobus sp.]